MRFGLTIMAAGALLSGPAAPVLAQDKNGGASFDVGVRLVTAGAWRFWSRDMTEDGPVCTETWTFRADGTATVISGEQRIEKRWRASVDDDGTLWLYTGGISSSAGRDCTGTLGDPVTYPRHAVGMILIFLKNGNAITCSAPEALDGPNSRPAHDPTDDACWGRLRPLSAS